MILPILLFAGGVILLLFMLRLDIACVNGAGAGLSGGRVHIKKTHHHAAAARTGKVPIHHEVSLY